MKVNSIGIRYNECKIEEVEKLTEFETMKKWMEQMMYDALISADPL